MRRISTGIFVAPGHKVTWSASTKYMRCECAQFAFAGKCEFSEKTKEILKNEGKQVKSKRAPKPLFIQELDNFKSVFEGVLKL